MSWVVKDFSELTAREIYEILKSRAEVFQKEQGIGTELMRFAIREIPKRMECKWIIMDAQKQAVPFYERLGFSVVSEEYLEEGIVHVDMSMEIQDGTRK